LHPCKLPRTGETRPTPFCAGSARSRLWQSVKYFNALACQSGWPNARNISAR
jgi:hypothetical protein